MKLVKENKDFEKIFEQVKWNETFDIPWKTIFDLIKNMPTTDDYELEWKQVDIDKLKQLLCEKHDFTHERVDNTINKLKNTKTDQQGLGKFF